jgi:DNA-binding CsgD family transcriptional regulator
MSTALTVVDEDQILELRLGGASVKTIARRFHISVERVNETLDGAFEQLSDRGRLRATNLELARLDELIGKFRAKALEGDPVAANLMVRLSERRCQLLGLDHKNTDPVLLNMVVNPPASSTDRIRQALDRLRVGKGGSPAGDNGSAPVDVDAGP